MARNALAALGGRVGAGMHPARRKKTREWEFRVYLHKDVWWIDLRKVNLGRMMMRDPNAEGWPAKGDTTTSEGVAKRWAGVYADRVEQLTKAAAARADVKELEEEFERFLAEKSREEEIVSVGTYLTVRDYLSDFCGGPKVDPRTITAAQVRLVNADWVSRGLMATTRKRYRDAMRVFFRWIGFNDDERAENANPAYAIKLPKHRKRSQVKWWTAEEMDMILQAAADLDSTSHDYPSFVRTVTLVHACGARENELFALRFELLDRNTGCIGVHGQIDRKTGQLRWTKGVEPRWAVMFAEGWALMPQKGRGWILPDPRHGGNMRARRQRNMIEHLRDRVQAMFPDFDWPKGVGWHSFRHTYATRVLDAGCSLEHLQQFLGHKTLHITQQHYQHYAPQRAVIQGAALIHGKGGVRPDRHLRLVEAAPPADEAAELRAEVEQLRAELAAARAKLAA